MRNGKRCVGWIDVGEKVGLKVERCLEVDMLWLKRRSREEEDRRVEGEYSSDSGIQSR